MHRFQTILAAGRKSPYSSWTFLIIPPDVAAEWGPGRKMVRGTIAGHTFRGTASRGEGSLRVPLSRDLREKAGLCCGDNVEVVLDLDTEPETVVIPEELREVFEDDPELAELYEMLPPAQRRAWASYVAEAKRPETRKRRAGKAPDGIRAREFPK